MLASLAFGNSLTRANDESLGTIRSAQQRVQAASYLRSADEPRSKTRVSCFNPEAEEMQGHVVGISDEYYRIDNAVQNDDGIYLVDAAVDGLRQQADCLASSILDRYQAMLNPEPETRTE
jgi:hypothetical protein